MPFLDNFRSVQLAHRPKMADEINEKEIRARFEELAVLEAEFEDVELEISTSSVLLCVCKGD